MFAFSIFFQTLSYILFATSQNIGNYFVSMDSQLLLLRATHTPIDSRTI